MEQNKDVATIESTADTNPLTLVARMTTTIPEPYYLIVRGKRFAEGSQPPDVLVIHTKKIIRQNPQVSSISLQNNVQVKNNVIRSGCANELFSTKVRRF